MQGKGGVWCIVSSSVLVTSTHGLVFSSAVGHYSKSVFRGELGTNPGTNIRWRCSK